MSPGSVSLRSSSLLAAEDVSSRRERRWREELGRQPDVESVVAARLDRQRRVRPVPAESSHQPGANVRRSVSAKPSVVSRASVTSTSVKRSPASGPATGTNELRELQWRLFEILRSFEFVPDMLARGRPRAPCSGDVADLRGTSALSAIRAVRAACHAELEAVKADCFKPSPPPSCVQRVVRVHRTLIAAVRSLLSEISRGPAPTVAPADRVDAVTKDVFDTVCLLCGVVGNVRRPRGGGNGNSLVHLDILDWVVTNGPGVLAAVSESGADRPPAAKRRSASARFGPAGAAAARPPSRPRESSSSSSSSGGESAVGSGSFDGGGALEEEEEEDVGSAKRLPPKFRPGQSKSHQDPAASPQGAREEAGSNPDYWNVVEKTAAQLIEDILDNVDAFVNKAEEDAIRKILDRELYS